MITPVHRISIANENGDWFDITNTGPNKNIPIGVESIKINKTKDDYAQECVITLVSKYDLNSVVAAGSKYQFNYTLPTNDEVIFQDSTNERYGQFPYDIGDMVYIEFGYNEDEGINTPEGFFGFVSKSLVIDEKKVSITVQNHAYLLKKNLYNFSVKEDYPVATLYKKIVDDYNETFFSIYDPVLNQLQSKGNTELSDKLFLAGKIDTNLLTNVTYKMRNFRAENSTAVDILDYLQETYFTRTLFFQIPSGKTYLLGGFLNLLQEQKIALPEDLAAYLNISFSFKNYDLKYDTYGLTEKYINEKIRELDSEAKPTISHYDVLSKSLTWQEERDVKVEITFKINDRKAGTSTETTYGDKGGESKVIVYFESKTAEEIKNLGAEYLDQFKYTGYKKGSTITTYGFPTMTPLDQIYVVQVYLNGGSNANVEPYILSIQKYQVETVSLDYGKSGLRQTVGVGQLLLSDIQSKPDTDNQEIFLKEEDTGRTYTQKGNAPVSSAQEFNETANDYQLLNQIDVDLSEIEEFMAKVGITYGDWITKTNELKNIVFKDAIIVTRFASESPGGKYTKTDGGNKANFEEIGFTPDALTPNGTIKLAANLMLEISNLEGPTNLPEAGLYQLTLYYEQQLQVRFKQTPETINAAKAKGLDTTEREAEFERLKENFETITKAYIRTIKNFDNEANNYTL